MKQPLPPNPARKRKRVPWAVQPKSEVRKILQQHSAPIISASALQALNYRKAGGAKVLSVEEKIRLLKQNEGDVARNLNKIVGNATTKTARIFVKESLGTVSESTLNALVDAWIDRRIKQERADIPPAVEKRVRSYLKARKIPIDNANLDLALTIHFRDKGLNHFKGALDLKKLEGEYIALRKGDRFSKLLEAHNVNSYLNQIVRGLNLTQGQKIAVKRWLRRALPVYHKTRLRVFEQEKDFHKAFSAIGILESQFIRTAREQFVKEFKPTPKKTVFEPKQERPAATKIGSREERLAAYVPGEKTQKQRISEMEKQREASKQAHRQFDSVDYSLREMERENEASGRRIAALFRAGHLGRNTVVSLFTGGSLTQRTFLNVLENSDFRERFSDKELNALAKGLSYIGPKGRLIGRAQKSFQSPKSSEIFSFLASRGFLETAHGGGKVVYLAR